MSDWIMMPAAKVVHWGKVHSADQLSDWAWKKVHQRIQDYLTAAHRKALLSALVQRGQQLSAVTRSARG